MSCNNANVFLGYSSNATAPATFDELIERLTDTSCTAASRYVWAIIISLALLSTYSFVSRFWLQFCRTAASRATQLLPHHTTAAAARCFRATGNAISASFARCTRYENESNECIHSISAGHSEWKTETTSISSVRILFNE